MNILRNSKTDILMVLLLAFVLMIAYYRNIQEMLILESNHLLTGNEVVLINDERLTEYESLNGINYRMFITLQEVDSSRIYAFYAVSPSRWSPPMSEGSFFSQNNTQEAVVGRGVEIEETAYGYVYNFNGQTYQVIGVLGLTTPSPLDEVVLLNTSSYIEKPGLVVTLDYDRGGVLDIYLDHIGARQARGVSTLLEVDFFTPLIVMYSWIIMILMVMVIGYLSFLKFEAENAVRYLVGENVLKIFGRNIFDLLVKWLFLKLVLLVIIRLDFFWNTQLTKEWLILSIALIATYTVTYFNHFKSRGNQI